MDSRLRTTSFADTSPKSAVDIPQDNLRVKQMNGVKWTVVTVTTAETPDRSFELAYSDLKGIGNGSFGVVYQARIMIGDSSPEVVAIKKVLQDRHYKNRELQIMRNLSHCNVVKLKYFFFTMEKKEDMHLNLILEFMPETVAHYARSFINKKQLMPIFSVKLYMYQLLHALAYIHAERICHRDIKPQNLLVDPETGVLKLCDFGRKAFVEPVEKTGWTAGLGKRSAKVLLVGEQSVSYICSRYYRAPELLFGSSEYTVAIDLWSSGCVVAELLVGSPVFPGETGVDQLLQIMKHLGTPTREEIQEMNPMYTDTSMPGIQPSSWSKLANGKMPADAVALCNGLLRYSPSKRFTPLEAMTHPFFDDLRVEGQRQHSGARLPQLFNFTVKELAGSDNLRDKLVPAHVSTALGDTAISPSSTGGMRLRASSSSGGAGGSGVLSVPAS